VFDAKTFTLALNGPKTYWQAPAAMTIDEVVEYLAGVYGLESPLADMLVSQPCAAMQSTAGVYVGKGLVGKTVCDHLFFQGKDVDWQLWVPESGPALPSKMVITEKRLPKAPQFEAVFSDWKTGEAPQGTFTFVPPAGFTPDEALFAKRTAKN
jgi:hypothetical protein